MRRVLTSWTALMAILVVVCVAAGLSLEHLQSQVEERAEASAIETANVVAAMTVGTLQTSDFIQGSPTVVNADDMDRDVAVLKEQGRLLGLEVWHLDGRMFYADPDHPASETSLTDDELMRAAEGESWVAVSDDAAERGVRSLDVRVLYDIGGTGTPNAIVEVVIPQDGYAAQIDRTTQQLNMLAGAVVAAAFGLLLLMRRRMRAREYDATHDSLTGLLNRAALRARLAAAAVTLDDDNGGHQAALLILDLEGFKAVNDTLGHPAGDTLLVQVARTLQDTTQPTDVAARLGGDEFAILLTSLPDADEAHKVAACLLNLLRHGSYTVHGVELNVDASIGIAMIPQHGRDPDLLLQRADVAMYQAKRAGSGVVRYDEATDTHDITQLGLLVQLRRAIENDELVLHYQPKARLDTGDLAGLEALVRWQHPTRGLLSPAAFIPLAEHTGLLQPLTEWILASAIAQAAAWRDGGLMLPIAVNISPRSLLEADLPATVLRLMAEVELPADLLELEVTETAIMTDPERAIHVLRNLHAMGVRVAIDDFGSGYTSLSYLKQLPVQTLKIDRTLVADLLDNIKDEAIAESIILLGHKLGLTVLAEGIETPAHWQRLADLKCDEGQGYHLGHPMPAGEITEWVTERITPHTRSSR